MKKWYNVQLNDNDARELRFLLKASGITYETSGAGHLTHFEVFLNEVEKEKVETLLQAL